MRESKRRCEVEQLKVARLSWVFRAATVRLRQGSSSLPASRSMPLTLYHYASFMLHPQCGAALHSGLADRQGCFRKMLGEAEAASTLKSVALRGEQLLVLSPRGGRSSSWQGGIMAKLLLLTKTKEMGGWVRWTTFMYSFMSSVG